MILAPAKKICHGYFLSFVVEEILPTPYGASDRWRERAAVARTMAEFFADPMARNHLLEIATRYDEIAERAASAVEPDAISLRASD